MLAAARAADASRFGDFASRVDVVPRVVEYHTVTPGGALRHEEHYDHVEIGRPGPPGVLRRDIEAATG